MQSASFPSFISPLTFLLLFMQSATEVGPRFIIFDLPVAGAACAEVASSIVIAANVIIFLFIDILFIRRGKYSASVHKMR